MRYLGIDYGSKRVGIAFSDDKGVLAFPSRIIQNDKKLIDTVCNICKKEDIISIVVGESLNFSGEPNKIMKDISEFKNELESNTKCSVHLEKEFMTTIFAREKIFKRKENTARKIKKGKDAAADASAAALILQRFLDRKNKK